jgi:hypothetical protein
VFTEGGAGDSPDSPAPGGQKSNRMLSWMNRGWFTGFVIWPKFGDVADGVLA